MQHQVVIGLEVHVQLLTQTKLFCGCSTKFGQSPNTATCPVCTGSPGSLPVMNRRAFFLGLKAALALNCEIPRFTKWDRKNYFYPDLPKNYQISQYDLPMSKDGWLEIPIGDSVKRIGIIRAHLEEDAGKMSHDEAGRGADSLVDLNRTGTPLLEIVSEPDMEAADEAKAYVEELRLLLREIGVSDCEMQEGSLRCDANVNVHLAQPDGTYLATPLVEIKNLNSIRSIERSIRFEADRQIREAERRLGVEWSADRSNTKSFKGRSVCPLAEMRAGKLVPISKATAGWDDRKGVTEVQRRKEEAADYRYFPDPDLARVIVDDALLESARAELGELPAAQKARLQKDYALSEYDAGVLTRQGRAVVAYFESATKIGGDAKEACNWLANDVLQLLNETKTTIETCPVSADRLGELIRETKAIGLNKQRAREVFAEMASSGAGAKDVIAAKGFKPMADEGALLEIVRKAIAGNPKAVADFKAGKVKAADAIKGAVMRETKGMAKMEVVQKIVMQELGQ